MPIILVANPKGGSGKTTLSTNLAGYLAHKANSVALGDMDRQQSSLRWLDRRGDHQPHIRGWDARKDLDGAPKAEWTVLDSPAGIHGKALSEAIKLADRVVVPVQPSAFDMWATEDFLELVAEEKAIRKHRTYLAVVGMRVRARTQAASALTEFLNKFELPVLTCIRDTQVYVGAGMAGQSIFDLPPSRAERDIEQWHPLLQWLEAEEAAPSGS